MISPGVFYDKAGSVQLVLRLCGDITDLLTIPRARNGLAHVLDMVWTLLGTNQIIGVRPHHGNVFHQS